MYSQSFDKFCRETRQNPNKRDESHVWEHLDELRIRLIKSLLCTLALTCVAYLHSEQLVQFIEAPILNLLPAGEKNLYYTGLTEKVFIYFKVSFLFAVIFCLPIYFLQIWKFIEPGLIGNEKRHFFSFVILGSLAFVLGVGFCYFAVLPSVYGYLLNFGGGSEKAIITLNSYFDLSLQMLFGMGLLFELPLLMAVLSRFGVVNSSKLIGFRRNFLFVNAVFSAVVTPSPDFFSLAIVMIPIALLYEFGILVVSWTELKEDSVKES